MLPQPPKTNLIHCTTNKEVPCKQLILSFSFSLFPFRLHFPTAFAAPLRTWVSLVGQHHFLLQISFFLPRHFSFHFLLPCPALCNPCCMFSQKNCCSKLTFSSPSFFLLPSTTFSSLPCLVFHSSFFFLFPPFPGRVGCPALDNADNQLRSTQDAVETLWCLSTCAVACSVQCRARAADPWKWCNEWLSPWQSPATAWSHFSPWMWSCH